MINFEIKNNVSLTPCGRESQSGRSLLPICEADTPLFLSAMDNKKSISEKITSKCPQSGRSMIEMLGVLAIIGVLSVGGIAGYSKAMMKYRINKSIEQITLIAGNVRAFWGPQRNYDGVDCGSNNENGTCPSTGCRDDSGPNGCPIHKKAKIFPDEMITITDGKITSITNPFGGEVGLHKEDKAHWGDNQAFFISYGNIPEEACIELVSYDWTSAGVVDVYSDVAKSGEIIAKVPLSVDNAVNFCADLYDENTLLYFDFDIDYSYYSDGIKTYDD